MRKVIITCKPDTIVVEGEGFHGEGCKQVIDNIVQAMGAVTTEEPTLKDEYYATEEVQQKETA